MKFHQWINATIVFDTALHIGADKNDFPADSMLRRVNDNSLVIPGRALGGCLRSIADRLAPRLGFPACKRLRKTPRQTEPCGCIVCRLFGERYPSENQAEGSASKLWFFDAVLPVIEEHTHIRDGVGIERAGGATARNIKFDYEVLPAGACFPFRVEWKLALSEDEGIVLSAALAEWENGRGQLGGHSARGLGAFHLEGMQTGQLIIDTPQALMGYLRSDHPTTETQSDRLWYEQALSGAVAAARKTQKLEPELQGIAAGGFLEVSFSLAYQGQALTHDPMTAALSGYDHAPLVECLWPGKGKLERPVLSGASLRGALRAHAERIARTLARHEHPDFTDFVSHCPVCDPLARDARNPDASCDARLETPDWEETDGQDLCLGCRLFGSQRRGSRLWIRDAAWSGAAKAAWMPQDFLAVDRFTGGGQDGAKFDAAGLTQPRFTSSLLLSDPQDWELAWLILLLRDLAEGELVIGFGGAKGYGLVKAEDITWTMGFIQPDDLPGKPFDSGEPSGVYQVVRHAALKNGWLPPDLLDPANKWMRAFQAMVKKYLISQYQHLPNNDLLAPYLEKDRRLAGLYER